MAGTVIDSLVVTLGLDPSSFNKEQKAALSGFKKFVGELEDQNKRGAEAFEKTSAAVGALKKEAFALFAGLMAARSIKEFVTTTVSADAALGRLSRSTGNSVDMISRLQNAAKIYGGDAQQMATSITTLSDAFAGWKIGIVSPLIADLRAISTAGGKVIDVNGGIEQSFIDLADNLKKIHDEDPARAGLLGRRLGLDSGTIDLLIQGGAKVREVMRSVTAVTDENTAAADRLQKKWGEVSNAAQGWGRTLLTGLEGPLTTTMNWIERQVTESATGYKDIFGGFEPMSGRGLLAERMRAWEKTRATQGGASSGAFSNLAEKEAFIRDESIKRRIDPNVAMLVSKREGFSSYYGDLDATGKPTSFGAFQLHYAGIGRNTASGLGEIFTRQTGKHASDPTTERDQIRFTLDWVKTHGWSDFHGWKGDKFAGIGGGGGVSTTKIDINGPININAGPNADGAKMAEAFRAKILERQSYAAQANYGQN